MFDKFHNFAVFHVFTHCFIIFVIFRNLLNIAPIELRISKLYLINFIISDFDSFTNYFIDAFTFAENLPYCSGRAVTSSESFLMNYGFRFFICSHSFPSGIFDSAPIELEIRQKHVGSIS